VFTERTDAYDAKNRYGMPTKIELPDDPAQSWSAVWQHIAGSPPVANISPVPEL
jgi:hypothetical protein